MSSIQFKVNGSQCLVGDEVSSTTTLLEFLRTTLECRGTKYMCLEGGCGACIVSATTSPDGLPIAVNSCLVSVTSCQGWEITTIEKLGNRKDGYHPLMKTLAEANGTQCGYCSPGFVMSMYSKLKNKTKLRMLDIERDLSSNICRCTGYRPILEAFKKFASDAPKPNNLLDIEELKLCSKSNKSCSEVDNYNDWYLVSDKDLENSLHIKLKDNKEWFRVSRVAEIFSILEANGYDSYMLVAGNTGKGVIPITEYPRILIDITGVSELKGYVIDQNLVIGAGTTINEVIDIFNEVSYTDNFNYLKIINEHLQLVANVAVRNLATLGGNLMVKHQKPQFASDIFLLLQIIGAQVTIKSCGFVKAVTVEQFLYEDMTKKLIINILLPPMYNNNKLVTYRIAPKSRNAHAIVNAAFNFKLNLKNKVVMCRITFGGLSPQFSRATNTENFLRNKTLFNNDTLQQALQVLSKELKIVSYPPEPSIDYKEQLALGLFYKGLLSLCPQNILNPRFKSGAVKIHEARPVSQALQSYDTNSDLWPLNQPVPKVEALIQCSGESEYTGDLLQSPKEVFASFVLSSVALGTVVNIDTREAMKLKGVISFYSWKDIPGINSFTAPENANNSANEELLCSGEVVYYNQPIGLVVAETNQIANKAALLVKVEYSNVQLPKIDIRKNKSDASKSVLYYSDNANSKGHDVFKKITGIHTTLGQYHFCMENMTSISWPIENVLKIWSSSHYLSGDQLVVSRCLNIDQNRIDIAVRRVGGSFGIKLSRQTLVTTACALVAYKLNRPCRITLPMQVQMRAVGKRMPASTNYEAGTLPAVSCEFRGHLESKAKLASMKLGVINRARQYFNPGQRLALYKAQVGVNNEGLIQYLNYDIYYDNGCIVNELLIILSIENYHNCYNKKTWNFKCFNVITDTPSNTWCRAPATLESIASCEFIMERISYELAMDPIQVRINNLDTELYNDLIEMINTVKTNANYTERRTMVDKFNVENRWKKRGLRLVPMSWKVEVPFIINVTISVFNDGSVAIAHGGVEIGQGINTKAIQVCAYCLNIPINKIEIIPSNIVDNPNNGPTAGSKTTQNITIGVQRACKELLQRLEPIKSEMNNPTWKQTISKAYEKGINLKANGFVDSNDNVKYNVYGVSIAEVEVDILTGEWEIIRVDLLEDAGQSLNPKIDIGQIEGAFIMSLGYWTSEELIYDQKTGELKTNRAWEYFVPQATDIPQDFRVQLRKNSYTKNIIMGSKSISESSVCMGVVVPLAMREAIVSARSERGIPSTQWFNIDGPHTIEKLCLSCETKFEEFKFY